MKIGKIIKSRDIETYRNLKKLSKHKKHRKKNEIKLGDRPERLMQHNAYKRVGRRVKQIKWG